jgi:hypothetical protein
MKGEMSDEQELERKVITNQMTQFLSNQQAIYLASLVTYSANPLIGLAKS